MENSKRVQRWREYTRRCQACKKYVSLSFNIYELMYCVIYTPLTSSTPSELFQSKFQDRSSPSKKTKTTKRKQKTNKPRNKGNKTLRLVLLVHLLFFIHFSLSVSLYLWNYSCQRLMIAMLPNPLSLLSLILDFHEAFTIVDHSCSIVKHSPLDYYDITFLPHRLFLLILLLVHLPPLPNFEMLEIPLAQFSIYSLWLDNLI